MACVSFENTPKKRKSESSLALSTSCKITRSIQDSEGFHFHQQQESANEWIEKHIQVITPGRGEESSKLFRVHQREWKSLSDQLQKQVLKNLSLRWARGELSFPWKRYQWSSDGDGEVSEMAKKMMSRLRDLDPKSRTDGHPVIPHHIRFRSNLFSTRSFRNFRHLETDYEEMDVLVDLFQEKARLSARRQDTPLSPLEKWRDPRFVQQVLQIAVERFGELTPRSVREGLYHSSAKECTQFRPSLAKMVIENFGAKRVLDFSAGWGDRLAGALAAQVDRYQGFDPNTSLREGHEEILKTFSDSPFRVSGSCFEIQYASFEEVTLSPDQTYDLIFTSPPFFDFEIYTQLPGQSVDRYPRLEQWLVRFLFFSVRKSWQVLEERGHLVLHVTDLGAIKICEKLCLLIASQLEAAMYLGVMCSFGGAERPRPLWVFQKNSSLQDRHFAQLAANELASQHRSTWIELQSLWQEDLKKKDLTKKHLVEKKTPHSRSS